MTYLFKQSEMFRPIVHIQWYYLINYDAEVYYELRQQ
jgi:hypothetical protein